MDNRMMGLERRVIIGALCFFVFMLAYGSIEIIPEGHVGIVNKFGKTVRQLDPGLNFKAPLIESVVEIEVRQRKNVEELTAATQNQLATIAKVSINWTVDKSSAMDLYIQYVGLARFESRILDPKLASVAKASIAQYPADQLIKNRSLAVAAILDGMQEAMREFPITVNSPQIEDIQFPKPYLDAVLAKEQAREDAEKEKHKLAQQKLVAQQKVNTAKATRDAMMAEADGKAYQIKTEAASEAEAISIINAELAKSPQYIELVKAKGWDGKLPATLITGDKQSLLYQVK